MEDLEQALLDGLHQLPPDDQITYHAWAERWEEWVRQFGMDPLTFDFDSALAGMFCLSNVLEEAFDHPMLDNVGQQVLTTLVLMHRKQQEAST